MNEEKLIVFTLGLSAIGLYTAFLPPVAEVATSYQTLDEKRVLREAEGIGTGLLVLVGAFASSLSHSAMPVLLAVILGAAMFGVYEYAMARIVSDK